MNNKIKYLWLTVILLLVLNLATIGTIVYHNYKENQAENILIEPDMPPLNGMYFRHELGFNESQLEVFRQANRIFRPKANDIVLKINSKKEELFWELQAANPDSLKIKTISESIGKLHAELKGATADFYLSLIKVSNENQKEKLKNSFTPLFRENPGIGCGNGNRYLHGQGSR